MGKTRLRKITIRRFRSIKGEVSLEFPDRGMIMVRSRNLDSKGSSGGGKSSVLLALNAALDCCPYPMTELQSWGVEEPLEVTLTLDSEQHGPVVLTRGGKSRLKLGSDSALTSAKSISEKMVTILGLTPDMLAALTYCPQQDFDDFLTKTNAEKEEFLSTLLGLQLFESAVEKAQRNLSDLNTKLICAQSDEDRWSRDLANAESQLAAVPPLVDGLPDLLRAKEAARQELQAAEALLLAAQEAWNRDEPARQLRIAEAGKQFSTLEAEAAVQQARKRLEDETRAITSVSPEEPRLKVMLQVGRSKLAEVQASDRQRETQFRAECQALDIQITTIRTEARELPRAEQRLAEIRREIEVLTRSSCPTCSQQWSEAREKVAQRETEAATLETQIQALRDRQGLVAGLVLERQALKFEVNPLASQLQAAVEQIQAQLAAEVAKQDQAQRMAISQFQAQLSDAEKRLAEAMGQVISERQRVTDQEQQARFRQQHEIGVAQHRVGAQKLTLAQATADLDRFQQSRAVAERERQAKQDLVASTSAGLERARVSVAEVRGDLNAEEDFIRLVGREGFLGAIFDEVLAEISSETNAILGRVANTAHVALEFRSEVETKKGAVKKEIRPVVTIGGFEAPLKSGCSGGMYSAVRLAVRIAVRRVISRRTGSFPCWLALDESFDGLDHVSKEACMEILAEAATEDLILVVDHSSEFKELFTNTIDLVFQNGETRVDERPEAESQ